LERKKAKQNAARALLLAGSVLCVLAGIYRGETAEVFRKAVNICLQCIGLG